MPRPSRFNADYFTHSAGLRNDRRLKAIRTQFGAAGYGILNMILETLTDADYTELCTDDLELELLAGDFGVSVTDIHSLIQLAEKIGYFTRNDAGRLICPDLNKVLEPVFEKRNRSRAVAKVAQVDVSATETHVSATEILQRKEKERRENKIDRDSSLFVGDTEAIELKTSKRKNTSFQPPSLDEVKAYAAERKRELAEAEHYFDYYISKGWLVNKAPMKDWKAAFRNWERNQQMFRSTSPPGLSYGHPAAKTLSGQSAKMPQASGNER